MERKLFYITLDQAMTGISEVRTEDNKIQYEIRVTEREKEQIQQLLERINEEDVEPQEIIARPFNEDAADRDKEQMGEDMQKLFGYLYDYGTEKTRSFIEQLREH
ncbi:hypothetical protein EPH95_17460 [Salicibibacter halophilus]|uniref:Uncharacterized protein n=1 Tax=Salicibibacter halophilus TaxID=2502791 RepID=A0A514LLS3_9BACI|nr:hypothetical protein [Salicibibacter halophilus]QDI92753.1 hypothetical protein EPH95_17460 [Salicibibacter halophilus]